MIEDAMRAQRLATADCLVAAREQGIRRTSDIEYAVLEADGKVSFFTYDDSDAGAPESRRGASNQVWPATTRRRPAEPPHGSR